MTEHTLSREQLVAELDRLRSLLEQTRELGAESSQGEGEPRYRALFENMRECVAVYEAVDDGEDFVFRGFNRAAEQLEQVDRAALMGKRVTEVFPGIRELGLLPVLTEVWRSGEPRTHPVTWYDGGDIAGWRDNYVYRLPSGEVVAVYADVTTQMQAEEQLRRREAEFRMTFEASKDAIFWADPATGLMTRCNAAAEQLLGRPRDEIVGQPQTLAHPPDKADHFARMFREHIERDGAFEDEAEVITASGEIKPVVISSSVTVVGGKPIIQGVFRDISERRRAEQEIRASLREKEVLLGEIHHRVKNNLQVISSLLSLQSRRIGDEAVRELLRESRNRVRTMALTHEQLYRSEDLARVDLGRYVRDLAGGLFRSYGVDPGRVALQLDVSDARLPVDRAIPCGLIVNELVSNVLKHAFPGGRRGRIQIRLRSRGDDVSELVVRDDGVGLPVGLDMAAAESLGLQIVQSLAEQIGGVVTVARGGGTVVRVAVRGALDADRGDTDGEEGGAG